MSNNKKGPHKETEAHKKILEDYKKAHPETDFDAPSKPYKPPPIQPNLFDSFEQASNVLHQAMMKLGDKIIAGNDIPATLFKTTPGIGKTEAALHLVCHLAKHKKVCFFASATRDMSWQIYDRIYKGFFGAGLRPIIIDGRHNGYNRKWFDEDGLHVKPIPPNCHHYDKVEIAQNKGYPVHKYVCAGCSHCPAFKFADGGKVGYGGACEYYKRIYEARGWRPVQGAGGTEPIFLLTHHMLVNFHTDSETMKDRMDLAIYDEDPTIALRTEYTWDSAEIHKEKLTNENMRGFRQYLQAVLYFAEYYRISSQYLCGEDYYKNPDKSPECKEALSKSKFMNTYTLSGKKLADVLKHAAKMNKTDLMELLELTETVDVGLENGEIMNFPEFDVTQEEKLPFFKEPELANELKNIVLDAEKGEESAYKVSFRYDDLNKWSIVWDEVRQINYGRSLLYLDAYGEQLIADKIMGRPVDIQEVHCKVRENVNLKVFPEVNTSKKVMNKWKDQLFNKYVDPELRIFKGGKTLFYTQKCYAEWLKDRIEAGNYGFDSFVIKYFWQDRGDDSYGDFDNLCMIGTPWSNIIGERDFCNALFHGEEPIDWSTGKNFVPNDPRVKAHNEARQEKEMLQALFRLRPSKPRDKAQNILVFSNMKLPFWFEMPGATIGKQKKPSVDEAGIAKTIIDTTKKFGCWTDLLISFYSQEGNIFNWFDNGGLDSGEDFPLTYEELIERFKLKAYLEEYTEYRDSLMSLFGHNWETIDYRGRKIAYYGDEEKMRSLLDTLRLATRIPGADDEKYEPKAQEEPFKAPETEPAPGDVETACGPTGGENEPTSSHLGGEVETSGLAVFDSETLFGEYEEPSQGLNPADDHDKPIPKPPPDEE